MGPRHIPRWLVTSKFDDLQLITAEEVSCSCMAGWGKEGKHLCKKTCSWDNVPFKSLMSYFGTRQHDNSANAHTAMEHLSCISCFMLRIWPAVQHQPNRPEKRWTSLNLGWWLSSDCDDLTLLPIPHVWHMPFLLRLQRISSALVAPLSDLKQDETDSATSAIQFFWQSRQCQNMFTHVSDWSSTYSVIFIGHWTEVPESLVLVFAIAGSVKPDCQLQGWIWPL